MVNDASNKHFQYAADCINYTNRSVFLTGKAGTGKTTFLKYIKEHTSKQNAVLAPTGVAAINAGGVTIHSFFQLPFAPYIPESRGFAANAGDAVNKHALLGRMRFNKNRIQLLQEMELLIIDEISMVRCDVLDAVDMVLRHFRNRYHEPFGGVQLLFIGDMFQLPPVAGDNEWNILSQFYQSPYFFDSKIIQEYPPLHIELHKIYRQSDGHFIDLLNNIRNNNMDEESIQLLHSRYLPAFQPKKEERYITLATHNYKADLVNATAMQQLNGELFTSGAAITGDFSEKMYPAEKLLQLKTGAQVMFIKNDAEEKKYFNGKIGIVQKIDKEKIYVQSNNEELIEVKKETWKNIHYRLDTATQKIEEEEIGSFTQYPLRLAWAITIHKSQGLTFDKAIIDAGDAFTPGQVYVALSRCTSLDGLVLRSRIGPKSLYTDERISAFAASKSNETQLLQQLFKEKHHYQHDLIIALFSFEMLLKKGVQFISSIEEHASAFNEETLPWLQKIELFLSALDTVAQKFQPQLENLLQQDTIPEENEMLQYRIRAAAEYFVKQLNELLRYIAHATALTDSRQYALAFNEDLKDLHAALALKYHLIHACIEGFSMAGYQSQKNKFVVPSFYINVYAKSAANPFKDNPHPALLKELRRLRDELCEKDDLPIYIVAGSNTLDEMARFLPQTRDELIQVSGFGKAKLDKYGQQFLDIILLYCTKHNLSSLIHEKEPKRQRKATKPDKIKNDTKTESFKLYKEGKTIKEIATARNLTTQTIEGHLAHYVQHGEITIDELVSREKFILIEPLAKTYEGGSVTSIKEQLVNDISFGEIRLVLAWMEFEKNKNS